MRLLMSVIACLVAASPIPNRAIAWKERTDKSANLVPA